MFGEELITCSCCDPMIVQKQVTALINFFYLLLNNWANFPSMRLLTSQTFCQHSWGDHELLLAAHAELFTSKTVVLFI